MGSALWSKQSMETQAEFKKGTNSGARQNEKYEDDRLQLVIKRNEDPNYFLQD